MTTRTQRLLVTLLTFIAVAVASAFIMRYVIRFLLAEQFVSLLAWVLIGTPLIAIFSKQRWLWTVFIVTVLLYAFVTSGVLESAANEIWAISTLICAFGGTIYIRRPRRS